MERKAKGIRRLPSYLLCALDGLLFILFGLITQKVAGKWLKRKWLSKAISKNVKSSLVYIAVQPPSTARTAPVT